MCSKLFSKDTQNYTSRVLLHSGQWQQINPNNTFTNISFADAVVPCTRIWRNPSIIPDDFAYWIVGL